MRLFGLLACFFLYFSSISLAQKLKTTIDSISYSAGISAAVDLQSREAININPKLFAKGFTEAYKNKKTLIDKQKAGFIFGTYLSDIKSKEGRAFMAANAKKEGVISLPSGLQYEVLIKGPGGQTPLVNDKVKAHYHGMLINGDVFDSSVERGEPVTFQLNQVLPGWVEGIQLMSIGDKYKFYIPYHLAYGELGAGNVIPPYAALIFEVELLAINHE